MDIEEKIEQEAIKNMFKLAVYRNNKLSQEQKQFAMNRYRCCGVPDWLDYTNNEAMWLSK